ncbi:unnamed protein product [Peniophora sp. CBMAI 1063]|nr:unnamed protein product [Peniophora sp. CBMAI 1063]
MEPVVRRIRPTPSRYVAGVVSFLNSDDPPGFERSPLRIGFYGEPTVLNISRHFPGVVNWAGQMALARLVPMLSRVLTGNSDRYEHQWYDGTRHVRALQMWYCMPRVRRSPAFADARYILKISLTSNQRTAGVDLAYAITRILDGATYKYGLEHRPRVVGFAHLIRGREIVAMVMMDGSARTVFEDALRSQDSRWTGASRHVVTTFPRPQEVWDLPDEEVERMGLLLHFLTTSRQTRQTRNPRVPMLQRATIVREGVEPGDV